jgi:hypothetical protein
MPSSDNQDPGNRIMGGRTIVRIVALQLLALLALSAAAVGYVNWSSDAAWAEFSAALKPAVSVPAHAPAFPALILTVKGQKICPPKA